MNSKQSLILALMVTVFLLLNMALRDPFSQRQFPCHEDEVLMFIDTPGKNGTGCVALDYLLEYRQVN